MAEAKTVLIIDDDPDILESTEVVLESAGYAVLRARNTDEAMERLETKLPDLILLDVSMTVPTEGFHFSYTLREDPVYAKIPIIIVSGISEKTGFEFSREKDGDFIQADDFLDKPVHPQTLLSRISALLEKKSRSAEK